MKTIKIGLAGLGTVGSGVANLLLENREALRKRTGCDIILATVAEKDANKIKQANLPADVKIVSDALDLVKDSGLNILIELMGGLGIAKSFIEQAVASKRQVITANKALLAHHGAELFALAEKNGVTIRYEASVAGGIPVVQTLRESLAGNQISSIMGILNGTGNYILSEMTSSGSSFEAALKDAQEQGFAEADPSLDIDGHDTAHKLALLIRLAWGVEYPYDKLPVYGIRNMHKMDIDFARHFGFRIKLLGQARKVNGKIEAGVFPTLVNHTYLLARVGGAYNGIRIEGNGIGSLFLHGLGAGNLPTASAILADVAAVARNIHLNDTGFIETCAKAEIISPDEVESPWYLRFTVQDCSGVLRDLAGSLARENVSIAQAIQRSQHQDGVPLVFKTHVASALAIKKAVLHMQENKLLTAPPTCYRILE